MTSASTIARLLAHADDRIVLHNVSWQRYEELLAEHADASAPRFCYDRGTLEIMSPLPIHETANRAIADCVVMIVFAWGWDALNLGSTTFRREELARGFEPDTCFYFEHSARMRGKELIDLRTDPAPELVIEIDITHSSLDKHPIFAALGVNEVWRYDDRGVLILVLREGGYVPLTASRVLPGVTGSLLHGWVRANQSLNMVAWRRKVHAWARRHRPKG